MVRLYYDDGKWIHIGTFRLSVNICKTCFYKVPRCIYITSYIKQIVLIVKNSASYEVKYALSCYIPLKKVNYKCVFVFDAIVRTLPHWLTMLTEKKIIKPLASFDWWLSNNYISALKTTSTKLGSYTIRLIDQEKINILLYWKCILLYNHYDYWF